MAPMVKQKVTVQPGGVVQVQSSELIPGSTADVIVIPDTSLPMSRALANAIGSAPRIVASDVIRIGRNLDVAAYWTASNSFIPFSFC